MEVIICDDRKIFFKELKKPLEEKFPDFTVRYSRSALDAVDKVPEEDACLVIAAPYIRKSIERGELDGLPVLVKNAKEKNPQVLIIVCSGESQSFDMAGVRSVVSNALADDFKDRLYKSIEMFVLKTAL
ncbi:MAG: hypothetical protein JWM20_39 [Patescibacteria group bacterium]|nr:hypothetical protein [Patescibacteria group bacterium]